MLSLLHKLIGHELADLMKRKSEWKSVHVTYHAPRVERLWIQHGDLRVFLHRIHPCDDSSELYHPHPWPSAVRVVSGKYEHKIGTKNEVLTRGILGASFGRLEGSEYEMVNPNACHSVRPLGGPSDSIMIAGPLHEPRVVMPHIPVEKQGPLDPERFEFLFEMWHDRINQPVECDTCGWKGRHYDLACYEDEDGNPVESRYVRCPHCMDEDQVGSYDRRILVHDRESGDLLGSVRQESDLPNFIKRLTSDPSGITVSWETFKSGRA